MFRGFLLCCMEYLDLNLYFAHMHWKNLFKTFNVCMLFSTDGLYFIYFYYYMDNRQNIRKLFLINWKSDLINVALTWNIWVLWKWSVIFHIAVIILSVNIIWLEYSIFKTSVDCGGVEEGMGTTVYVLNWGFVLKF